MTGFRGSEEDLCSRFGTSARLRARIGALLGQQVDVSEAVLELAAPGSPLERLLLAGPLLAGANRLDSSQLENLAAQVLDAPLEPELAVRESEGWRTILLAEELLAEVGFSAAVAAPPLLPVAHVFELAHGVPALPREDLLPPGEEARVRLTLLTGVEPGAKIEALRKLRLTRLPLQEKAALLIGALGDEAAEVRGEAALCLPMLGIEQEIAETIQRLAAGSEKQQLFAVDRLLKLYEQTTADGRMISFSYLGRALQTRQAPAVRDALLDGLSRAWDGVEVTESGVAELVRMLVGLLADDLEGAYLPALRLVRRIAAARADALQSALLAEAERTTLHALRATLLTLAAEGPVAPERAEGLAAKLAGEVDRGTDLDPVHIRLAASLESLGAPALGPLIVRLQQADDPDLRCHLIRLLDGVCHAAKLTAALRNQALEALLQTYMVSSPRVGLVILETDLLGSPGLSKKLRARLAAEVLANIHRYRMPRITGELDEAMLKLGLPACAPVLDLLRGSRNHVQRERTARIMGELLRRLPPGKQHLQAALDGLAFCETSLADPDFSDKDELFVAWGKIVTRPDLAPEQAEHVVQALRDLIWRHSATYRILEGLSWAASSPVLPYTTTLEVADLFLGLLDGRLPRVQGQLVQRGGAAVFELGPETTAYTDLIPVLLGGLERIYLTPVGPGTLREVILKRLLGKWQELVDYRTIWSPGAVTQLGVLLGRLAAGPGTPDSGRLPVVRALRGREDNFAILAALAAFGSAGPAALDPELSATAEMALGLLEDADYQQDDDREALLDALSRLLRRPRLGTDKPDSDARKQRILRALFEGARAELPRALLLLQELLDEDVLAPALRKQVEERMPGWR